jgi:hypothetical protein
LVGELLHLPSELLQLGLLLVQVGPGHQYLVCP